MACVLIVDDENEIRTWLADLLERNGYRCRTAANFAEAEMLMQAGDFELALVDVNMPPGRSGLELVAVIAERSPDTAIVMVSGVDDLSVGRSALEAGAFGYIIKPFTTREILIQVHGALQRRRLAIENRETRAHLELAVLSRTREMMAIIDNLEHAEQELLRSREETIIRLMRAAEFRDHDTGMHIQRISHYSALLARVHGADSRWCELLRMASPLHDIGKLGTPDYVLLKPGPLTPEEMELMKRHTDIGYRILTGTGSDLLEMGAVISDTHHEKFDGSGYPHGLRNTQIPLEGRITAVADVFDAMTSKRVYKPSLSLEEARSLMEMEKGKHFDGQLVEQFFGALDEVQTLQERFGDHRENGVLWERLSA